MLVLDTALQEAVYGFHNSEDVSFEVSSGPPSDGDVIIDSGCSSTLVSDKVKVCNLQAIEEKRINSASNKASGLVANHKADLDLITPYGKLRITNVLIVKDLRTNLISESQLTEVGCGIMKEKDWCEIYLTKNKQMILTARRKNGLYFANARVDLKQDLPVALNTTKTNSKCASQKNISLDANVSQDDGTIVINPKLLLWHRRYMHVAPSTLYKIKKANAVRDLNLPNIKTVAPNSCTDCTEANIARKPYKPLKAPRATERLEVVFSDLMGPFETNSLGNRRYCITFIDDYSRYAQVAFLSRKSQAFQAFKEYHTLAERQTGCKLKRLQTDLGGEYLGNEFQDYLTKHGIKHSRTTGFSPESNGISERLNKTLMSLVRSTITSAKLPKSFWAELTSCAVYIRNRCTNVVNPKKTPLQLWYRTKTKPTVKHLRAIGCLCYVHIPSCKRKKLDPKGFPCALVGYDSNSRAYRLWDIKRKRIVVERNIHFYENVTAFKRMQADSTNDVDFLPLPCSNGGNSTEETSDIDDDDDKDQGTRRSAVEDMSLPDEEEPEASNDGNNTINDKSLETKELASKSSRGNQDPNVNAPQSSKDLDKQKALDTLDQSNRMLTRARAKELNITPAMINDTMFKMVETHPTDGGPTNGNILPGGSNGIIAQLTSAAEKFPEEWITSDLEISAFVGDDGKALEPKTYSEAMSSPDSDKWAAAIAAEYGSLIGNHMGPSGSTIRTTCYRLQMGFPH